MRARFGTDCVMRIDWKMGSGNENDDDKKVRIEFCKDRVRCSVRRLLFNAAAERERERERERMCGRERKRKIETSGKLKSSGASALLSTKLGPWAKFCRQKCRCARFFVEFADIALLTLCAVQSIPIVVSVTEHASLHLYAYSTPPTIVHSYLMSLFRFI